MPPQPYIPGWTRVVFRFAHEGSTILVPFNFKTIGGSWTSSGLNNLCSDLFTNIWPLLQACMATTFTLTLIEATDRSAPGGAYGSFTPTTGNLGTKNSDALPASVANVIKWTTGFSGRRYRGRTYVPGFVDADATGSTFVSSVLTQCQNLAAAMLLYVGPGTPSVDFAIASIKDLALRIVTGYAVDAIVDSQRRRLPGRGF